MPKLKIREVIVVEGKYDKMRLNEIVDATIIETHGFSIYKNQGLKDMLKKLAVNNGVIILTDSDRAGFLIRNHIKSFIPNGLIKNVYIPNIFGKEKRKEKHSAEGTLGVEGIPVEILEDVLRKFALTGSGQGTVNSTRITKRDLYNDGLTGCEDSAAKRDLLRAKLGLPRRMSTNTLLSVLNTLLSVDGYKEIIKTL